MKDINLMENIKALGKIVRDVESNLSFTILEIGAVPLGGEAEPVLVKSNRTLFLENFHS